MKQALTTGRVVTVVISLFILLWLAAWYWSMEPDTFSVSSEAQSYARQNQLDTAPGFYLSHTMHRVGTTLLEKPGGYTSNDVLPPFVLMDNMPSWEFGVLEMTRDLALAMRKDLSRSQSQSIENPDLVEAQPKFNIDHRSWMLPSAESQYQDGLRALERYLDSLADNQVEGAQFYTRADNLRDWLKQVEKRLGSLSQRLSASVGQDKVNTDLAGDPNARQSTQAPAIQHTQTSWWQLDNVFYESRGASWALLHYLKAVEVDFADVLEKKNARVSLQQIIRELEATQQTVWSPMILNGDGFGMMANHSLVMANYLSRANAAIIDLSELLQQG